MRYTIKVLRRARADIEAFHIWIAARSPRGAKAWYSAQDAAVDDLRRHAIQYGVAPESAELGRDIRQVFFKTRRGQPYRIVYLICGSEVRVLRIRGPGQSPISADDLGE